MSRVAVLHAPGLGYVRAPRPSTRRTPSTRPSRYALLRNLGLDRARAGSAAWNPLGDLIAPGDHVIVKPNLVSSKNLHEKITGERLAASSTHGSLLRPILDYALRAAGPRGRVRVVDTPVEGCEIEKVAGPLGIFAVIEALKRKGHDVGFVDMRVLPRRAPTSRSTTSAAAAAR